MGFALPQNNADYWLRRLARAGRDDLLQSA
jgi:hypothetical protein